MSVEHLKGRKGAFRIALIPPEVLVALNDGLLETVNLNEFMALELPRLARSVAGHIGLDAQSERLLDTIAMLPSRIDWPRTRATGRAAGPRRSRR